MSFYRRILAIDPANRTGWAYRDGGNPPLHGSWLIAKPGDGHPGDRLLRLRDGLVEFLGVYPAELVACEDAHFGARNHETAAMHSELRGVLKLVAREHGAAYVAYKPNTIKKFATGYGLAKKPQIVAACKRLLGIDPIDDNVADALFILELARQRPAVVKPKPRRSRKRAPQRRLF
jgi:Holliday junction resolvasome RuvABC endonuclease subunit